MPTWLSDPSNGLYLVLFVLVVIAGAVWARYQDRRSRNRALVALAAFLVLLLCDLLFESPREQATRKVQEMAAAATARDPDKFVANVSNSFRYGGADRERLRSSRAWEMIRQFNARVAVWGFSRDDSRDLGDDGVEIGFFAKGEAPDGRFVMRYIRAVFVKDPDGQYRLRTMSFHNPAEKGLNAEDPIPGFP